jgi:putative ubiquitin-RnfH superfamily antitoxin RatB of RatAB toxin-antitoxin module
MKVTVVWASAGMQDLVALDVEPGTTAADAVARSGLAAAYGFDAASGALSIFGRRIPPTTRLAEGDRVELARPLIADPKEARRRRAGRKQPPRPMPRKSANRPERPRRT